MQCRRQHQPDTSPPPLPLPLPPPPPPRRRSPLLPLPCCSLRVLRVLRVLCVCCGRVLRVLRVLCVLRVLRVALRTAWRATRATDRSLAVRACGLRPTSGCRRGRLSRSPHFGTLEIPLDFVARCFALLWN